MLVPEPEENIEPWFGKGLNFFFIFLRKFPVDKVLFDAGRRDCSCCCCRDGRPKLSCWVASTREEDDAKHYCGASMDKEVDTMILDNPCRLVSTISTERANDIFRWMGRPWIEASTHAMC